MALSESHSLGTAHNRMAAAGSSRQSCRSYNTTLDVKLLVRRLCENVDLLCTVTALRNLVDTRAHEIIGAGAIRRLAFIVHDQAGPEADVALKILNRLARTHRDETTSQCVDAGILVPLACRLHDGDVEALRLAVQICSMDHKMPVEPAFVSRHIAPVLVTLFDERGKQPVTETLRIIGHLANRSEWHSAMIEAGLIERLVGAFTSPGSPENEGAARALEIIARMGTRDTKHRIAASGVLKPLIAMLASPHTREVEAAKRVLKQLQTLWS